MNRDLRQASEPPRKQLGIFDKADCWGRQRKMREKANASL